MKYKLILFSLLLLYGLWTLIFTDGDKNVGGRKNGELFGGWTKQLGTSSDDLGNSITTDSSGNIYVTGETGEGLDGNKHSGKSDIFLIKYNASGTKQWTKQLGTSSIDLGIGVTTDSSGNIYLTGFTKGVLDGNTNSRKSDIFLIKYNSSGTKQWTKQPGTSLNESGSGVTTDSSGNIYVTGTTKGGLDGNTN